MGLFQHPDARRPTAAHMNDVARFLAIEEIKQLKARYMRSLDVKDWNLLRSALADDVELDYRGAASDTVSGFNALPDTSSSVLRGADHAVRLIAGMIANVTTVHYALLPEIEIKSEEKASGIWAMMDILRFPDGSNVRELIGYGHYHEEYERDARGWRIKSLRLSRLRTDMKYRNQAGV
jgi:hypothetical protein